MRVSQVFQMRIFLLRSLVIWDPLLALGNRVSPVLMTSLLTGVVTQVARSQKGTMKTCRLTDPVMFDLFHVMANPATLTLLSSSGRVRQMRESQVFQTRICCLTDPVMFDLFHVMANLATLTLLSSSGLASQMRESLVFQTRIFLLRSLVIWDRLLALGNLVRVVLMTSLLTGVVTQVARSQKGETMKICRLTDQVMFDLFHVMAGRDLWTAPSMSGNASQFKISLESLMKIILSTVRETFLRFLATV
jgi:hypothetical protein